MPETMPWKQGLIYLTVFIIIPTSTSMAMNFCNGDRTVKAVNLVYTDSSVYKHCICHVQHTDPDETKNYTVKSRGLEGSSVQNSGCYNLSFISGEETKVFVNENKGLGATLFTRRQDNATTISLELSDFLKSGKELKIKLISGDRSRSRLKVSCDHIEQSTTTDATTTVTESLESPPGTKSTTVTYTSPPDTKSTQVTQTLEGSSVREKTETVNPPPTSTVGSQGLPSSADKESGSTIPIAGGVIGGVLCITVITVIICILRKRSTRKKEGQSSKASHDNPTYGAPGPDVIYDLAKNVTEKSRDIHDNDANTLDSNYFTLEDNGGNEGYSYVSPSNVGHTDGRPSSDKTENQEEDDDCYNHTNIAAESRDRPKEDNYVNVAARTREDYDHIKTNTGITLSNPSDKDEYSYNHPGEIPFQNTDSEDCYNHLGPSSSQPSTEDCYNHVGQNSSQATINPEDCYNHLGLLPSQITMDSDDGYSRAGNISPQTMNAEDCSNHLR